MHITKTVAGFLQNLQQQKRQEIQRLLSPSSEKDPFLHRQDITFNVLATKIIFIESFSKCGQAVLFYFEYILYNNTTLL